MSSAVTITGKTLGIYLDSITIPQEYLHWAIEILRGNNELEANSRSTVLENHRKNYDGCLKRIDNLINLYISPDNVDRSMLSETEFKDQKNNLVKEKEKIELELRQVESGVNDWLKLAEETFEFATYAKDWFEKGSYERKQVILNTLGQNFYMKDGKLSIDLKVPYLRLKEGFEQNIELNKARLEPALIGLNNGKNSLLETVSSQWSG